MRIRKLAATMLAVVVISCLAPAQDDGDDVDVVKKAIMRSTLNQPGTKPFHLKAALAPSFERDRSSGRTGEVEIWWVSPTKWKREVQSPEFHQIAIVNDDSEWQKNDGDYFPEWLRETAIELIDPVPYLDQALEGVKGAEVRHLQGTTYYSWQIVSTDGTVQKGMGASVAITHNTGLLFYGGGLGWDDLFHDYKDFHGRMVARTVSVGTPEVTAKVATLEDLPTVPPGFFDVKGEKGDTQVLRTVLVEETLLRKNLLSGPSITWPPLRDGPLEGVLTTEIVVDRAGKVREIETIVSDHPGVSDAARQAIAAMRFKPYMENGVPVQVVSRITMPFKTARPAGVETLESARTYFERGRRAGFLAAGASTPYILKADFEVRASSGAVGHGTYTDVWLNEQKWRRETQLGDSRYVRSQNGEKRYELSEGPNATFLRFVLWAMEPIPAVDTVVESDWKIRQDTVDGVNTFRVFVGAEKPDGKLDPNHAHAFWFGDGGKLLKVYSRGQELRRSDFRDFRGVQVAHQIDVMQDEKPKMLIRVTGISPEDTSAGGIFDLPGHESEGAFAGEVR